MEEDTEPLLYDVVVIGGGIAGVTCVESLLLLQPNIKVALISCTSCVKCTTNVIPLGQLMQKFDVIEQDKTEFTQRFPTVKFLHGQAIKFDADKHIVFYRSLEQILVLDDRTDLILKYKKLCVCTGGEPNVVVPKLNSEAVIGIRDVDSVELLQKRLQSASHVAVLGNGGIANEFVCEVESCDVTWVVKDNYLNSAFLDPGASEFLINRIKTEKPKSSQKYVKRPQYESGHSSNNQFTVVEDKKGPALGPDWHKDLQLKGLGSKENVNIQYNTTIKQINLQKHADCGKIYLDIELDNGYQFQCDFLVCATGVNPAVNIFQGQNVKFAHDGGIEVNESFETSLPDVYAAGDCCSPGWEISPYWVHMRLWTQAKQMGTCVARSIITSLQNEPKLPLDICFDVFTHVTTFFGFKVILLGNFNAKGLEKDKCEILLRCTKDMEYIKVVLHKDKMCGAILIGETDYEETFENLILNQFDLGFIKDQLLNPDVDIDDYFD